MPRVWLGQACPVRGPVTQTPPGRTVRPGDITNGLAAPLDCHYAPFPEIIGGGGCLSDGEADVQARVVVERYRLLSELGRGGMGVVWRAEDELVGRQVAVKELRPPQGLGQADRKTHGLRALAEARSVARIDHPAAVRLYDVLPATPADDAIYLIMELVEGPTLAQLVERGGPLPEPEVAAFGLQLLSVLEAAHSLGIVHRDIKPSNIIIAAGGQAKLTDFGIAHTMGDARLTRSGIMGTQAYLAPELFDAAPITPAADLWSLGATLYAAVQGQGPFERASTGATLRAILIDDVPAPGCEPMLATAISAMLQRDPARRVSIDQARAQLVEAAAALAEPVTPQPADARPPGPVTPQPGDAPPSAPGTPPPALPDTGTVKLAHLNPAASTPAPTRAATTSSPSGPPRPAPQPTLAAGPGRGRRRLLVTAAVAAALAVATAVVVPVLVMSGSHAPALVRRPTLAATLADPRGMGVISLAFSPDGQMLAAQDYYEDTTYLWDVATDRLTAALTDPNGNIVFGAAFSPDGKTLAVGDSDGSIYLWDVATRRITATLTNPGHDSVASIALSPDGRMLAAGDWNGKTYVWDVATRHLAATLTDRGGGQVQWVAFSPDGTTLAAVDDQSDVYLWDVATGRLDATLKGGPQGTVLPGSVAFSPDGKLLAANGLHDSVGLWDEATGHLAATLSDPSPAGGGVNSVAFSPDGRTLAAGDSDDSTYLWDVDTSRITATLPGHEGLNADVESVAFSSDGELLAVGDSDDNIYLWQVP